MGWREGVPWEDFSTEGFFMREENIHEGGGQDFLAIFKKNENFLQLEEMSNIKT